MFWTFAGPQAFSAGKVRLAGETGHHLARVRRVRPGEEGVVVCDGLEHHVTVERAEGGVVLAQVKQTNAVGTEPSGRLILLQAVLPNPDFDAVLEAGTALGVAAFWPVQADRSVARPPAGRLRRWQAIVQSAAEQSHRGAIPQVRAPLRLGDALGELADSTIVALDPSGDLPLREMQPSFPLAMAVGPEGGWTEGELATLRQSGALVATLGPRILRARLAPIAAAAIVIRQ